MKSLVKNRFITLASVEGETHTLECLDNNFNDPESHSAAQHKDDSEVSEEEEIHADPSENESVDTSQSPDVESVEHSDDEMQMALSRSQKKKLKKKKKQDKKQKQKLQDEQNGADRYPTRSRAPTSRLDL